MVVDSPASVESASACRASASSQAGIALGAGRGVAASGGGGGGLWAARGARSEESGHIRCWRPSPMPVAVRLTRGVAATAPCDVAAGAWLAGRERGAYTTARTARAATAVFDLAAHINRLASSASLMGCTAAELVDPAVLRPAVVAALRAALAAPPGHPSTPRPEVRLTMLTTWTGPDAPATVSVHAAPLPPPPPPPVLCLAAGAPRANAAAKDSGWVTGRAGIEAARAAVGANEALLVDAAGRVVEGASSNFAAIDASGRLVTAGTGMLAGTVRGVLLSAAASRGVAVALEAPLLADAGGWQGAFVTSTSRLALPVDALLVPGEERGGGRDALRRIDLRSSACPLVALLAADVAAAVDAAAEAVAA